MSIIIIILKSFGVRHIRLATRGPVWSLSQEPGAGRAQVRYLNWRSNIIRLAAAVVQLGIGDPPYASARERMTYGNVYRMDTLETVTW